MFHRWFRRMAAEAGDFVRANHLRGAPDGGDLACAETPVDLTQPAEHILRMSATLQIELPAALLLHAKDEAALRERSRFLLALKYFELAELSSGQAAAMCGMSRAGFLAEAARHGVPAAELSGEELQREFGDA
jgi:hypothetical protein